jgi:TPR repeat protein
MNEKIKCLENKAEKGDTEAMFFLGSIYKYDFENEKKAIEWFKKVGDGRSFFEIGGIHYDRTARERMGWLTNPQYKPIYDTKTELIKCYKWYDKAAQLGYERAMEYLSTSADSPSLREKWSIELAKKGKYFELFLLAGDYERGTRTIKPNPQKAFQLYKKAVDMGDLKGKIFLGEIYFYGKMTSPDVQKGLKLIKESADLGNDRAIIFLQELKDVVQKLNL